MLTLASIKAQLDKYFLIQNGISTGTEYLFSFTTRLNLRVQINDTIQAFLLNDKLSQVTVNVIVANNYASMSGTSKFVVSHHILIADINELEPLNLLKQMSGNYGFDTGREIDATYKFFSENKTYYGKNNPAAFIQHFYNNLVCRKPERLDTLYREFSHTVELPAREGMQLTLYVTYLGSEYQQSDDHTISLTATLNPLNDANKHLGASLMNINIFELVENTQLTTLSLVNMLGRAWEIDTEEAIKYAVKILTIDEILNIL